MMIRTFLMLPLLAVPAVFAAPAFAQQPAAPRAVPILLGLYRDARARHGHGPADLQKAAHPGIGQVYLLFEATACAPGLHLKSLSTDPQPGLAA